MDSRAFIVCLALATSLDATAGGIYKCVDGTATSYQSSPCSRGQGETALKIASVSPQAMPDSTASAPVEATATTQLRKRGPWRHASVEIGISDDEVLNMPGWGRPAQISRARVGRAWEEVWRYGNGYSGERQLRFVNARLADVVEAPAALASAR